MGRRAVLGAAAAITVLLAVVSRPTTTTGDQAAPLLEAASTDGLAPAIREFHLDRHDEPPSTTQPPGDDNPPPTTVPPSTTTPTTTPDQGPATLWTVGDIAECGSNQMDDEVGAMLASQPGWVMTLGDTAYSAGRAVEFRDCFDPAWGVLKPRLYPVVGNNEYNQPGAQPYYDYFGPVSAPPFGWYAFELGSWHVIVLNSNCVEIDGCSATSPQGQWLADQLAADRAASGARSVRCTLVAWHHPTFSSARHGNDGRMNELWQMLDEHGAEIVLGGHDHTYERFAPQTVTGVADPSGMRQFVVGTGGKDWYRFGRTEPNSEARGTGIWGALGLTLADGSYSWDYRSAPSSPAFTDSGSASCG